MNTCWIPLVFLVISCTFSSLPGSRENSTGCPELRSLEQPVKVARLGQSTESFEAAEFAVYRIHSASQNGLTVRLVSVPDNKYVVRAGFGKDASVRQGRIEKVDLEKLTALWTSLASEAHRHPNNIPKFSVSIRLKKRMQKEMVYEFSTSDDDEIISALPLCSAKDFRDSKTGLVSKVRTTR